MTDIEKLEFMLKILEEFNEGLEFFGRHYGCKLVTVDTGFNSTLGDWMSEADLKTLIDQWMTQYTGSCCAVITDFQERLGKAIPSGLSTDIEDALIELDKIDSILLNL